MDRDKVLNLECYLPKGKNVHMATYNPQLGLYWIDIPVVKLDQFEEIVMAFVRDKTMRILRVPTDYLRTGVRVYKKGQYVSLEIMGDTLQDRKGLARKAFSAFISETKSIV